MLQACLIITRFYQNLARFLARTHSIPYPQGLERVMLDRLEQLCKAHPSFSNWIPKVLQAYDRGVGITL